MTAAGGGKPPKPAKPFLGEDDLVSELDAWEGIFDALHEENTGLGLDTGSEAEKLPAPMDWPEPVTRVAAPRTPVATLADEAYTMDESLESIDDQMTLDRAYVAHQAAAEEPALDTIDLEPPVHTRALPADETDFSGIGADQPPAAMGRMLRSDAPPPPQPHTVDLDLDQMDDVDGGLEQGTGATRAVSAVEMSALLDNGLDENTGATRAIPTAQLESFLQSGMAEPTNTRGAPAPSRVPNDFAPDADDIYTSASRPAYRSPFEDDDDVVPPPPAATPPVMPILTGTRSGPAIVRRMPTHPGLEEPTPNAGVDASMFADENTRVADLSEIEEQATKSARHEKITTPPPIGSVEMPEEDDYELEIDADSSAIPERTTGPIAIESAPIARRTAHVLRRTEQATRPPPSQLPSRRDSDPVIEMNADEGNTPPPAAAPRAASEDDFSDVAAAVGAVEDLPIIDPKPPLKTGGLKTISTQSMVSVQPVQPPDMDELSVNRPRGLEALDELSVSRPARHAAPTTPPPAPDADADGDAELGLEDQSLSYVETGFNRTLLGAGNVEKPTSQRPPALTDLYPRVKTPTSVPPLGMKPTAFSVEPRTLVGAQPFPATTQPPEAEAEPEAAPRPRRLATPSPLPAVTDDIEPQLDLGTVGRAWPEQVAPLPSSQLDEAFAQALIVYEREVSTLDDSAASAALRIEAGRLCERLADGERARTHYDAALLADPRATAALRGLRRIARATGDLVEVTRYLDTELDIAGALERRPLGHYRIDLLMASGEQDMARVAVGEILDRTPSDVRALLAHLELAFLDGRADEFGAALEQLAHAVTDNELRAAVQSARGVLAAHHNDTKGAAGWFAAAAESDPTALAARLGAVRHAAAQADGNAAARALLDLARQIETNDPTTAAAAAIRAAQWSGEQGTSATQYAAALAPADLLVARLAAEHAASGTEPASAGQAFAHWSRTSTGAPAERAYAAARAAELDPGRGTELWATVLALDPGDDYAAAQLRTAHVATDATQASIDVDLAVSQDMERDRARLRAAYGLIAQSQLEEAIDVLAAGRAERPGSLALSEALGEALAAAGKWTERARLFADMAGDPGEQLDRDVAGLRSATAWEEAVGALAAQLETAEPEEQPMLRRGLQASIKAALEAWERVLEHSPQAPTAHAAVLLLASRLGNDEVLLEALRRAALAERSPLAAASLALRRARLVAATDPGAAEAILRDLPVPEDPRRALGVIVGALRTKDLGDIAVALEARAALVEQAGPSPEGSMLRLRAAQIALDAGDATRATRLLQQVETALPSLGIITDLLAAARRRAGDRPGAANRTKGDVAPGASTADAFARLVRDADLAAQQGDGQGALALYQRALELKPEDPLAMIPLVRTATQLREPAPVTRIALAHLRVAEDSGDGPGKAVAYELLAHIDAELRADIGSAQIALESASQADPSRIDLMHRLERHYASGDQLAELLRLRQAEFTTIPDEHAKDRAALQLDIAGLATRDHRPDAELAAIYRDVLAIDPASRLALLHLESTVRRGGFSEELATLEEQIAAYFEGDPRAQAAFWTRAGETLAEIGKIDEAVQRFGRAEQAVPGHVPALEGWRHASLRGQLWVDVAEASTRQAANTSDAELRGALHHFAGVALMDKALVGEQAMGSFRRALEAAPGHKDAFLRLRILLEEDANHDDLATLLVGRLDVEKDPQTKSELHRAVAELHRNFLSDRDTAKQHYRAILEFDPNDLRAHAAIADIAWEVGDWQEAADALMARARLERQPEVLKNLCFRLGLIYAERIVDIPMALKAFQRALTFGPDDEQTLVRLADLATGAGEWKLALGACERLVKNEADPDRRASHLHRVARIFKQGFNDSKRAERALNLALDGAPTNDDSLQQLVQFYKDARDLQSVRVHLNRVSGAMRAKLAKEPREGIYYRVISRAMAHRANAGVPGSTAIARAAAEFANLLGAAEDPEQKLLLEPLKPDIALVAKPEADEVLFPRSVQIELRQLFHLLGDRIAKHVGVDLRAYGATRGDRLRGREHPVASVAQTVASALGFENEIDVYVSNRQPWAMVAEPTSPVSLIIGSSIAAAGGDAIRFAAGSALKLAQSSLAIPARLAVDDLGVLVISLMRQFQPEFPALAVDPEAVASQTQKLKRLIPNNLLAELKPFSLAIDPKLFDHRELARDLKVAGLRAGVVTSGSLLAGLRILAGQAQPATEDNAPDLAAFLTDPVAHGLVTFALSEDLAVVAR